MKGHRRAQQEAREQWERSARTGMTSDDMIACALRRDRLRLRESQRAYAVRRGLSSAFVARLESRPGDLRLGAVVDGLAPTAYALALVPNGVRPSVATELVDASGEVIVTAVLRDGGVVLHPEDPHPRGTALVGAHP